MKTLVTLLLSFLVFFQSIGLGISDVFMLTDLVEHAKFHSEVHGDDFFTFLDKHYGSLKAEHQEAHKEEKTEHEKLPFQNKNCNHLLPEVVVQNYELPIEKSIVLYHTKHHFFYQNGYNFLDRASIFQPPRTA